MNAINVIAVWSAKAMTKNTAYESNIIDLDGLNINGFFSAQLLMTDAGADTARVKLQWGVSNDGTNFIYSSDASDDIVTAFSSVSGPGSDGKAIYSFDPIVSRWIRFKATETSNTEACALTLDVAMH